MIIQQDVSSPVITSIGATPTKFKIKASKKAFKILSGFYSEPIMAIPRELGANAWDAHVKAGNTEQMFEVHAPNSLEPWFSIRDYGTGLSPEDIDQIYTTYFESTKTADNDSDGCMGLGSKTPFNYTENFMVTSYFKGTKYIYSCFIDDSGSPNIMPVSNETTTEHNGLEIKFGIKIADISMFVEKMTRAYEPFRFRPIIKGASIVFKPREYAFQGKVWGMRKTEDRYNRSGSRAFMGNYSYPISYDSIRGYIAEHVKDANVSNRLYTMFQNGSFDFFFEIGDLEVAPNKEQLQYDADNKTAKAICDRAILARTELQDRVNQSLLVPKTRWEAMSLFVKYNSYNGEHSSIRNVIGDIVIRFNGEVIDGGNVSLESVNIKSGIAPKNVGLVGVSSADKFTIGVLSYRAGADKFIIRDKGYYNVTDKGNFPIFLYTAEENLKKSRIRHFLKEKFPSGNIPDTMLVIDKSAGFKYFKAHCAYLGIPDTALVHVEDLPKPPRILREAKTATTNEINYAETAWFENDARYGQTNRGYWAKKANTFSGTETYYYIDFYYNDPILPGGNPLGNEVNAIIRFLKDKKVLPNGNEIIWGINVKNKHLLKIGNWINIHDLAKKEVLKHKEEWEHNLYLLELDEPLMRLANVRRVVSDELLNNINNKETVRTFRGLIKLAGESKSVNVFDTRSITKLFDIKPKNNGKLLFDLKEFETLLEEKYMGVFSMFEYHSVPTKKLARIVNFIDEKS